MRLGGRGHDIRTAPHSAFRLCLIRTTDSAPILFPKVERTRLKFCAVFEAPKRNVDNSNPCDTLSKLADTKPETAIFRQNSSRICEF